MIRFKKVKRHEIEKLQELYKKAFPHEDMRHFANDIAWFVKNKSGRTVGFCSVKPLDRSEVFLSSCGSFRSGIGVQKKSIQHRLKWARDNGFRWAVTYADPKNFKSVANLIRAGFQIYEPEYQYVGKGFMYFMKELK